MEKWQLIDRLYSEEEVGLVKKRMERSGFDVKIEPRKTFGEMPCWDIYGKTTNPSGNISV